MWLCVCALITRVLAILTRKIKWTRYRTDVFPSRKALGAEKQLLHVRTTRLTLLHLFIVKRDGPVPGIQARHAAFQKSTLRFTSSERQPV